MSAPIKVALVGIGGYGNSYLRRLLPAHAEQRTQFVAGIDPAPRGCQHLQELEDAHIPIYPNLEQFYAQSAADLVIIVAPIHWHKPLTCLALEHGSHVLCEKPVTATIQDAYAMAKAADAAQRLVAIGYQWSFSDAIQALKRDILAGEFGRPLRLKTHVFWARPQRYFTRSDWAGKLKTADGTWVLDSIANNATAHYLHNMFYVLGDSRETSAWPVDVQAELYRANAIENYDAAAIRCRTADGVEILFYVAHCIPVHQDPVIHYEFERAVVKFSSRDEDKGFIARFRDGRLKHYGDPNATYANKIWQTIQAVTAGTPAACGIRTAMPHILCINGAQESMPEITAFPPDIIRTGEWRNDIFVTVNGLKESFEACYEQHLLPSEMGNIAWAKAGKIVVLRDYNFFPSADSGIS
jgi:predicted dehydrogenase